MAATNHDIKVFTEDNIRSITSNYSTLIGKGGFGEVYRGVLHSDSDLVAVKRYTREDLRREFMNEITIHSKMKHKNVVNLVGYCISETNIMLVTEYISQGNLDDILHKRKTSIPLDTRLGIAIGCAEALSYMHSMHSLSENLIYHGDIKPANILLDGNLTAKVSDFGLSRLLLGGITQYTSRTMGSIDYMDVECLRTGRLSLRSDVYSFGIVLLELIARKRAKEGDVYLVGTFASAKGKGLKELFDPEIVNKNNIEILQEMVKLANECLSVVISKRPQMSHVAKRLQVLRSAVLKSRHEKQYILATHYSWRKINKDMVQLKNPSFLKRNASNSMILLGLRNNNNLRRFTKAELKEVTENYSNQLGHGKPAVYYKATLEDNTVVVVRRFLSADSQEVCINGGFILSQIAHKNIIKLLGYCLEAETLILIYEYATKGSLFNILGSQDDFPLDKRMRIALMIAEALQYLHSSVTGIVGHGAVSASTILLDNYFMPKLTDFSRACKLINKKSETTSGDNVITTSLLEKVLDSDLSCYHSVLKKLESDVYNFGIILMSLISRDNNTDHDDLVTKFTNVYEKDKSGKAMFDKYIITAEEDINLLEAIGRLVLECTILNPDKMFTRPTMKEVAEQLQTIRRSWKECTTEEATTQLTESNATAVGPEEPRLPNRMRHLFGYRQISTGDPIHSW